MDIPLHIIKEITKDFSDEQKVGSGGYGNVYKGVYNGEDIAVKLLHQMPGFDENPFGNELVNLLSIKHPNIVRLVGYCYEIQHKHVEYQGKLRFSQYIYRILCFEYLQGGSLDRYLDACAEGFRDRDWCTHFNIINGICEGLNFLHEGCGSPILHLDLKPANILLDKNMVAKITDFGMSRLFHGQSSSVTKTIIGTPKYMPPEYEYDGLISTKNDVFSLGVIIIEIMAVHTSYYDFCQIDNVQKFIEQVQKDWGELINATTSAFPSAELDQVETCIKIAIKCVDPDRKNRPSAAEIVHILKETENWFPDEWRKHAEFLKDQSLPTPTKSGLVGGSAGTTRDIKEKPSSLESLTISYSELINAFSFSYIDQAGNKQTAGPWGEGYHHNKTETILLAPSEFVMEVSGTYGTHFDIHLVTSLLFVTNFRNYGPFGNPYDENTPFMFRADMNSSIVGFHGRSGRHLYSIGVYTLVSPSKMTMVGALPVPGQSLPTPTKSGLVGGCAGTACDIKEKPWRLESLTISYSELINAFSFSYTDQAGRKQTAGPWGVGLYHDTTETILFAPLEFVVEIRGTYGSHFDNDLVTSLLFVTNFRTYGPFGELCHKNVPATPFIFRADKDSSIVGFHGRFGQHLCSIGVYTLKFPSNNTTVEALPAPGQGSRDVLYVQEWPSEPLDSGSTTRHGSKARAQACCFLLSELDNKAEYQPTVTTAPSHGTSQKDCIASNEYDVLERMLVSEVAEPMTLSLSLLKAITNDFSDKHVIGRGGFAVVYKGVLRNGMVAVKKLSNALTIEENKFNSEVQCLMKVRHKNIVRFLGYCADTQGQMIVHGGKYVMADLRNRLLCFEFVPKKCLRDHITDASCGLEWRVRYQIIMGICEGLNYLHEDSIIHCDLKPANILLLDNMVPKIADFGLSRCFDEGQSSIFTSNPSGTRGYLAPEACDGKFGFKSDIYSLGVIIIEILTGRKGHVVIEEVLENWGNRLEMSHGETPLQQVKACAEIGNWCIDSNPTKRPIAEHIIKTLNAL